MVVLGDASESETRRLYREAEERVCVITNSFAYFDAVEPAVADALDRVDVDALFLHCDLLAEGKRSIQADVVEYVQDSYPEFGI